MRTCALASSGPPEEHAEAVLAGYEVLQQLHNRGLLEIMRGALAASDEILEKVVDNARTPEAIRAIRNLLFWRRILGSIEPDWFQGIFQAIPEGIAQATGGADQPVSLFGLLRRAISKDSLRGLAGSHDFLQAFGRHLHCQRVGRRKLRQLMKLGKIMTNRWSIAIAGVLLQVALGAVYAWSVFRTPLTKQFGWSIRGHADLPHQLFVLASRLFRGLWLNRVGQESSPSQADFCMASEFFWRVSPTTNCGGYI